MRNISLYCPNCQAYRAVGDPDEHAKGWQGSWYCFNCKSDGTFQMEFVIKTGATATEVAPEQPV